MSQRIHISLADTTTVVNWPDVDDDAAAAVAAPPETNGSTTALSQFHSEAERNGRRYTEMLERVERAAAEGGDCGYEREDEDSFIVDDDQVNGDGGGGNELDAAYGGGFYVVDTTSKGRGAARPTSERVGGGGAAEGPAGGSAVAVAQAQAQGAGSIPALVRHFAGASAVMVDALTALAEHWTQLLAARGDKGPPPRVPPSVLPYAFDVAHQAKLAHPRGNITADVVEHVALVLPFELDSIRALLKRAFKAGISHKHGDLSHEVARLDANPSARGAQVVPAASLPASAASAVAAAVPVPVAVAAVALPATPSVEFKTPAAARKAVASRRAKVEALLTSFRETLDSDIASGKITEPAPVGGESESKRRVQIFWRPMLKQLLGECVDAEYAAKEAEAMLTQLTNKQPVAIDDAMRDVLRAQARDQICAKVLGYWPAGWMTLQKCRATYAAYQHQLNKRSTAAGDSSTLGASTTDVRRPPAQAAPPVPGWKQRKRFFCVYSGCTEAFSSIDPLRKHVIAAHHDNDANAQINLPAGPTKVIGDVKCEVPNCWETFFAAKDLKMHVAKIHPQLAAAASEPAVAPPVAAAAAAAAPTKSPRKPGKRGAAPSTTAAVEASTTDVEAAESSGRTKKRGKKRRVRKGSGAQAEAPADVDVDFLSANDDGENEGEDDEVAPTIVVQRLCAKCGNKAAYECTGCRSVHYCSAECQTSSWKAHMVACQMIRGHKANTSSQATAVVKNDAE